MFFWELIKLSARRQFTYRAAALAGFLTNLFFGILRANVMIALYNNRPSVAGLTLQEAITFTGLSQMIIAYLSIFGWYDIINSVYEGDIAADLLKPMDYFTFWLGRDIGQAVVNLLLRGGLIIASYALFFDLILPASLSQWGWVVVALVLSSLVSFAFRFVVNLAAFWTPNASGVGRFAFGLSWVMSGFFLPLRYFPDWFVNLCNLTPFPSMVNTTIEIYLGVLQGPALLQAIAVQAGWALGLTLLGQIIFRQGIKRLVIQGG